MTPTEKIVATAHAVSDTQDGLGRILTIRQLGALDRLRLFKAVGPTLSENPAYLGMALLAFSVTAIDGVPVPLPGNEPQIESLVQTLGDEGLDAVAAVLDSRAAQQALDPDAMGN